MAIFTFSTKNKRPEDEKIVRDVKDYCERSNISFSAVVIAQLRRYRREHKLERRD